MNPYYKAFLQTSPLWALLAVTPATAEPRLSMAFQGDWDSAFSNKSGYKKGDVVSYNNVLYQSLISKNKLLPTTQDASKWRRVLEANSRGGSTGNAIDCEHPGPAANLIGCVFNTGTALYNQDLRGAQLVNASLAGDMGVINLDGANLVNAKLGLEGAGDPPSGTALTLQGGTNGGYSAKARGANLSGSETPYAFPLQAASVDFSNANLTGVLWPSANLEFAFMSGVRLVRANIITCNCANVDLYYADLRSAFFSDANFSGAIFYEADLNRAQLSGANLSNADLTNANLANVFLTEGSAVSNLAGANFSGANLTGADFTGAINGDSVIYTSATKFADTTCPDGIKVNGSTVTSCQGHGFGAPQ